MRRAKPLTDPAAINCMNPSPAVQQVRRLKSQVVVELEDLRKQLAELERQEPEKYKHKLPIFKIGARQL